MNDLTAIKTRPEGLALLREPFPEHQISKLPKPTAKQTADVKADFQKGFRCPLCGAWHHKDVAHLDYVGHAALTDRLLDCDPAWTWEPIAMNEQGSPLLERDGGMWIKLTVCGVTRLGYGNPDGKTGGNAVKETIGDALRNAAMRFGAALDLWHKGDLHGEDEDDITAKAPPLVEQPRRVEALRPPSPDPADIAANSLTNAESLDQLAAIWTGLGAAMQNVPAVRTAKDARKAALQSDFIPY